MRRRKEAKVKVISEMTPQEQRRVRRTRKLSQMKHQTKKYREQTGKKREKTAILTVQMKEFMLSKKHPADGLREGSASMQTDQQPIVSCRELIWRRNDCKEDFGEREKVQELKAKLQASPRTRINRLVQGREISKEINRKLVAEEALIEEVSSASRNIKSHKTNRVLHRILTGQVLKRYKLQNYFKHLLSPKMARKIRKEGVNSDVLNCEKAPKSNRVTTIEKLRRFFDRDDVSAPYPDAKAFVTKFGKNRVKKRKRFLLGSLQDLHKKCQESEERPVSFSLFCKLKPFWVVHKKAKERETCLCKTCENTLLLVEALKRSKVIEETSALSIPRSMCCESRTEDCLTRKCLCIEKKIAFLACDEDAVIKCRSSQQ